MPAGATVEGLPRERYPVSKTGGSSDLEGSTPSPSSLETWPSGKAAPCYGVGRFAASQVESCCLRCSGVVESVRHATVTREAQVRALPPEPQCNKPPWSK